MPKKNQRKNPANRLSPVSAFLIYKRYGIHRVVETVTCDQVKLATS